jgi:hypothetical protein
VICERDYEATTWRAAPPTAARSARCAARSTRAATTCCKPAGARVWAQLGRAAAPLLPRRFGPQARSGLGQYLLLMAFIVPLPGACVRLLYHQSCAPAARGTMAACSSRRCGPAFMKAYAACCWWPASWPGGWCWRSRAAACAQEDEPAQTRGADARDRLAPPHRPGAAAGQARADAANQRQEPLHPTVSHELRTPLNSILGYAQLLEDDPAMPPTGAMRCSVIRRGGDHLLGLIEGTLDLRRIEAGKLRAGAAADALSRVRAGAGRLFELQALSKGVGFSFEPKGCCPQRAGRRAAPASDPHQPAGNAVKFTAQRSGALPGQLRREMARVEIIDSGPGMSEDELERVFEPFARGSARAAVAVAWAAQAWGSRSARCSPT